MTLYEFQLLSNAEQVDLLQKQGSYIGKRRQAKMIALLYQLDAFYVEVFYEKYRCHVKRIHCFRSTVLLDPYLEHIDVEHLVS